MGYNDERALVPLSQSQKLVHTASDRGSVISMNSTGTLAKPKALDYMNNSKREGKESVKEFINFSR